MRDNANVRPVSIINEVDWETPLTVTGIDPTSNRMILNHKILSTSASGM